MVTPWGAEEQGGGKKYFHFLLYILRQKLSPVLQNNHDTVGGIERAGELAEPSPVHAHAVAWNRLLSG